MGMCPVLYQDFDIYPSGIRRLDYDLRGKPLKKKVQDSQITYVFLFALLHLDFDL